MPAKINESELNPETKAKLGLNEEVPTPIQRPIGNRVIALGNILACLKGLTHKEAIWALKNALFHAELSVRSEGYQDLKKRRKDGKKNVPD